ncbi:hypothetical protein A0256_13920 [Mucilaginibacter sp. PAMC 26640]|nr:hypothetical protein A0256_13920 [Mucilaginibacter sp. PAMC 26640]
MEKHDGHILEYVVRKNGISITDLAKEMDVHRRTIYNLFQQKDLKKSLILVVGQTIKYDFSIEFPEYFTPDDFAPDSFNKKLTNINSSTSNDDSDKWKDKYIRLLEAYNELLLN